MAEIQTAHAYSGHNSHVSTTLLEKYLERNGLLIDIAIFLCLSSIISFFCIAYFAHHHSTL